MCYLTVGIYFRGVVAASGSGVNVLFNIGNLMPDLVRTDKHSLTLSLHFYSSVNVFGNKKLDRQANF